MNILHCHLQCNALLVSRYWCLYSAVFPPSESWLVNLNYSHASHVQGGTLCIRCSPCNINELSFLFVAEPIVPCLYFEAELKYAPCRVKQMGFINVETREKIYCDIHDGHLQLPKSSSPTSYEHESFRIPDVVGCAVILSTGHIMFTLDGVPTGQFYEFPSSKPSSMVIENLFPYISCTRIRCNYGQRSFLFEDANSKESLFVSGALLHGLVTDSSQI